MSEVMLTIKDARRAIHLAQHGSFADSVVASLATDAETIEELEAAVARFVKPTDERGFFDCFDVGVCEEPWDAGIVLIDLSARVVAVDSTYSSPQPEGYVQYHDGTAATDVWVHYRVPDDWLFIYQMDGWRVLTERRRAEQAATLPLDAREVLYRKVQEFIVKACLEARANGKDNPIADIHARWLMTPRADLRHQSPRDVLLAKRYFIDLDIQWRANQWTFLGFCPPGLAPESAAYRFGGFGTHENVLYYELVRHLLEDCWHRLANEKHIEVEAEVARLEHLAEEWLYTPQSELHGMSPFCVISREQARLPVALEASQMELDDDCPLCQMLKEEDSPTFWHLDGSNMDYDFPFSFFRTREEWEEEQRRFQEFSQKWEERHANISIFEDDTALLPPVWQRSYSNWDALFSLPPEEAIPLALVGIGSHLAELGLDLQKAPTGEEWAESLRRDFANLRQFWRAGAGGLVETYIRRLCEGLVAVAVTIPDIADKCADLQMQLEQLGELCAE